MDFATTENVYRANDALEGYARRFMLWRASLAAPKRWTLDLIMLVFATVVLWGEIRDLLRDKVRP